MDTSKQWHGGKGSKRRNSNEELYADNWEKIFGKPEPKVKARKAQPKHSATQIHKDKSKVIPRHYKYNKEEDV
tara:strand:+ start:1145 stop:1363 length:219 start_codon:yes stop_codon:yes gene_type:complete